MSTQRHCDDEIVITMPSVQLIQRLTSTRYGGKSGANKSPSNGFFVTKVQGYPKSFAHHMFKHGFLRTLLLLQNISYCENSIEGVPHMPHADPHDTKIKKGKV